MVFFKTGIFPAQEDSVCQSAIHREMNRSSGDLL